MYARQIATAQRLLEKYGGEAVLRSLDLVTSDDPSDSWEGNTQAAQETPCFAVVIDIPDTGTVISGMVAYIPTLSPDGSPLARRPSRGMALVFSNGVVWNIEDVIELAPNVVETVMYTCKVARP